VSAGRPLSNRVDPFGELHATAARGALMGNRGGRFHLDDQTLGRRRWTSRRWIACVCEFKNRWRPVWANGYTELFFLDEPTALAAGHRPCFECRRGEAEAFRRAFASQSRVSADEMDQRLHEERLTEGRKRVHPLPIESLPDGAMMASDRAAFLLSGDKLLPWGFPSYGRPVARPARGVVDVLTPPSILRAIGAGYVPRVRATTSD
jgi:hypothetical protein